MQFQSSILSQDYKGCTHHQGQELFQVLTLEDPAEPLEQQHVHWKPGGEKVKSFQVPTHWEPYRSLMDT